MYGELTLVKKSLTDSGVEEEFIVLASELDVPATVPFVYVNGKALVGLDEIKNNLKYELIEGGYIKEDIAEKKDAIQFAKDKASEFSLLTILSAGFIDGLNPCALSMLIFFIGVLSNLNKKDVLKISLVYVLATFLTYTLLGVGLLKFLLYTSFTKGVGLWIYLLTLILCIVAFTLNIYDYINLKKGNLKTLNQLPGNIKKKIHSILEDNVKGKVVVLTVFLSGVFVSLLEFSCTGQVYLPTLTFILSRGEGEVLHYIYLLLYNILFIVPLVIVTVLFIKFNDIDEVTDIVLKRIKNIKLITALIFVVFIIYMLYRISLII